MAGGDNAEEAATRSDGNPGQMKEGRITHLGQQVCWVWQELEVPVIAAVHGHALGGGLQIALGAFRLLPLLVGDAPPDDVADVLERLWGGDETLVAEIAPDGSVTTSRQRYPPAGTANATIELGVVELATGEITWIDLGEDADIYLARVDWLPDSESLTFQRLPRDQRSLDLVLARADGS